MEMPTPTNPRSISHPEMTGSELNALKANIRAVIDSANVMNIISNTKDDIRVAEFAVPCAISFILLLTNSYAVTYTGDNYFVSFLGSLQNDLFHSFDGFVD